MSIMNHEKNELQYNIVFYEKSDVDILGFTNAIATKIIADGIEPSFDKAKEYAQRIRELGGKINPQIQSFLNEN
mgnify:CR=1 FL=1